MKLDNEYLDKEKVGKLLDFTFLAIKSKADLSIGALSIENKDKDKVELKELHLESNSDVYNPGYNRVSLKIKREECGFFRTKYKYEIDLSLKKGNYDQIDISDTENTDKIGRIFDFLMDIDYQKKKTKTNEYIDTLIGDLDRSIGLEYKRDDKINSLLDGK